MEKNAHILKMDNVVRAFGGFVAVRNLSLTIPEKMVFGLLGPNGAGKTTMLRMITGLIRPTSGTVTLFGGLDPFSTQARSQIGYMPQNLAVYQNLSLVENLLFFGRINGMPEKPLKESIEEVLDIIELGDWRNETLSKLSGGMLRRALLATALVHKPRLLLLDEPTAGVDPVLRIKIWDTMKKLCSLGTSILITTHYIPEADRCDRVVFLRSGVIIGDGTPGELVNKYGGQDLEQAFVAATMTGKGDTSI